MVTKASSLIRGQVDQIEKSKQHAITAVDAIMGTIMNIKEAVQCFREKRGTKQYHEDCDFRFRRADQLEDKATEEIRNMHLKVDGVMEDVEVAKQRNSSQQPASTPGTSHSGGNTFSGGNFLNANMFLPPTLKYSGVSLVALDSHNHKVKWLRVALSNKPVPDEWYVMGFSNTLDDEFKAHLSNENQGSKLGIFLKSINLLSDTIVQHILGSN